MMASTMSLAVTPLPACRPPAPACSGLLGQQGLRGHHVLDLAGADAVRQCAKRAVGAGVAVAADHRHAGQGGAVFGADHVHDALAFVHEGKNAAP